MKLNRKQVRAGHMMLELPNLGVLSVIRCFGQHSVLFSSLIRPYPTPEHSYFVISQVLTLITTSACKFSILSPVSCAAAMEPGSGRGK